MNETTEEYEQTYVVLRVQHPKSDHPYFWNWGGMVNALRRDVNRKAYWAGEVEEAREHGHRRTVRMFRNTEMDSLVD